MSATTIPIKKPTTRGTMVKISVMGRVLIISLKAVHIKGRSIVMYTPPYYAAADKSAF
jgi:hypothetical protein